MDPVIILIGKAKHSATLGEIMMIKDKDLWERQASLTALMKTVNGLCTAIYILLHPRILSADLVQEVFRHLLHIYSKENG